MIMTRSSKMINASGKEISLTSTQRDLIVLSSCLRLMRQVPIFVRVLIWSHWWNPWYLNTCLLLNYNNKSKWIYSYQYENIERDTCQDHEYRWPSLSSSFVNQQFQCMLLQEVDTNWNNQFHWVYRNLFKNELKSQVLLPLKFLVSVKFTTVFKTASPCKNTSNRICACCFTLTLININKWRK